MTEPGIHPSPGMDAAPEGPASALHCARRLGTPSCTEPSDPYLARRSSVEKPEVILAVCDLGADGARVPIYLDDQPSICRWIVVTRVRAGPPAHPVTFVTYFVAPTGAEFDFVQRDTLDEAIDSGSSISGLHDLQWSRCQLDLPESGFNARLLQGICGDAG